MGYHPLSILLEGGRALAATAFQSDAVTEPVPQKMVVLMHGWGADSQDLVPLAPMLASGCRNGGDCAGCAGYLFGQSFWPAMV